MTNTITTRSSRIEREIVYPYPPERVWRALTHRDALSRWLLPSEDFEPSPGHRFRFQAEPCGDWDGGIECQVLEVDAPHHLSYSWQAQPDQPPTLVTWTLEPTEAGGTHLRLEHTPVESPSGPCAMLAGAGHTHARLDWAIRLCLYLPEADAEAPLPRRTRGQREARVLMTAGRGGRGR